MATPTVSGDTTGLQPNFLNTVLAAIGSLGATQLIIHSGKRSDSAHPGGPKNTGAEHSNHLTGEAIDGYAVIGGKWVPLGLALQNVAPQFGLRSGMSFLWKGKPDAAHVDNNAYLGGVKTLPYNPATNAGAVTNIPNWPTGHRLTFQELENLWVTAGGSPATAPTAAAVALAESHGQIDALNAKAPDYSVGPWQINYYGSLGPSRTKSYGSAELLRSDPLANARAAVAIASGGFGPWSTYKSGAYKQYLGGGTGYTPTAYSGGFASAGGNVSTVPSAADSISGGSIGATPTGQTVTPFSTGASVVGSSGGVSTVAAPKPPIVHPANRPSYFQSSYGPRPGMRAPASPSSSGGGGGKGGGGGRAAAPFDWQGLIDQVSKPIDLTPYTKIANTQAAAATARLIAGIRADQQAERDAAALRATQQTQAALAASKYLQGLDVGGQVAGDYAQAAAAERAAAQGFSGSLRQTVDEAAARVQENLQAAGSPQTAVNQGAAAANALYGFGGYLPSQQLDVVGPAVAASYRAIPQQILGYGQTLAAGQLSLGEQEAAKLTPEITKARINQATLASDYFDKLSKAALDAGQDRIANLFKILGLKQKQDAADALAAWRYDQSHKPQIIHSGGDVFQFDPATGKTTQVIKGATTLPKPFEFGGSMWQMDPATGQPVEILRGGAGAGKALTPHTDKFGRTYTVDANGNVHILSSGIYTDPATHTTYTVGIDGSMTVFGQGAGPAGPAPSDVAGTAPPRFNLSNSKDAGVRTDQYGNPMPDKNGNQVLMRGFHWKGGVVNGTPVPNVKPGGNSASRLTPDQVRTYTGDIFDTVKFLRNGVPATDKTEAKPAVGFQAAVRFLQEHGYFSNPQLTAISRRALKRWYPDAYAAAQVGGVLTHGPVGPIGTPGTPSQPGAPPGLTGPVG